MAFLSGELTPWPSKNSLAEILRSAGLTVTVGRYSVRVEGRSRFKFQEYGGDLGPPVIVADDECMSELIATAQMVSQAFARAGVVHRFELYEDDTAAMDGATATYLHHGWPQSEEQG